MGVLELLVSSVKGVGEKKQKYFEIAGINSVEDLLYNFPRDYEDRRKSYNIKQLPSKGKAGIRAMVTGSASTRSIRRNFSVTRLPIEDSSGKGWAVWFNNPYTARSLHKGVIYDFFGSVETKFGEAQIQNPTVSEVRTHEGGYEGDIVPVYSKIGKLSPRDFERAIYNALIMTEGKFEDIFPGKVRDEYGLEEINYCIKNVHFPSDYKSIDRSRYRLAFQELFLLQIGLFMIKKGYKKEDTGISFRSADQEREFERTLPFRLTDAQLRAWCEIRDDMEKNMPMNRLLQGDVGSGKTVLAVLAMVRAVGSGYQAALMVPTEILAEQHYHTIKNMVSDIDINVEILVGGCSPKEREIKYERIKKGSAQIIIGTHALIQEKLEYKNLGIVITDEQHRFGVRQRSALLSKGTNPDVLVMTATPIPRTLALILYGDMDISIIDQMPPGRKTVKTYSIDGGQRQRAYDFIARQIREGRQGYIVCPLIESSDAIDAVSAIETYHKLTGKHFKDFRVSLLHGKISPAEKDRIMKEFRDGKVELLISTTVIEVGVNVPNANIMLVENAERFGLAQLHQLRGRVGRGRHQSYCILINGSKNTIARKRMKILTSSTDGFEISEKDLELRGPGDFFGTRQHGLPELKIAQLPRDIEILKQVQKLAKDVIDGKSEFSKQKLALTAERVKLFFSDKNFPCNII